MLFTFLSTGKANICTYLTNCMSVLTAKCHHIYSGLTDRCTFNIKLYAACHPIYILFLQTGTGAVITNGNAFKACFYAGFISEIHTDYLKL
jgi:hypothetical protein